MIELFPDETNAKALAESPAQANIRDQLRASLGNDVRYAIWDRRYLTIADWNEDALAIGRGVTASGAALLSQVLEGRTIIQMPGIGESITKDYPLDLRQSRIGIFTPIQDDQGRNLAALLIYGLGAQRRFNEILSIVQIGKTGETYAFDRNGLMISNSRFQDQLAGLGLLAGQPNTVSASRVRVCDPGGDLIAGFRPDSPPATWPLTKMARFATAGENGIDLDGYRDYRGATVVGAWKWLAPYDFGVAMEIELDEVNRPLLFLRTESLAVLGLLSVSLIVAMRSYQRLQRLRHQIGSQRQLGQYTLEEKIGEGGMGIVFRARHALLKRPTAIKLLKAELANARTIAWFEREVQLASQLTHPNTIEIYDYGVTPEGVFYYVMEFLDGTTLEQLVRREGPLDSPRVVLILQQIAGSLREAHSMGLVHRDIKPHNIMLCRRGGENDVVKVLDFGLVKQIHGPEATSHTVLAGTPMYMAPERLDAPQENDPRIDIYAFGAVGFFLLTGREIFLDDGVHGILHRRAEYRPATHVDRQSTGCPRSAGRIDLTVPGKAAGPAPSQHGCRAEGPTRDPRVGLRRARECDARERAETDKTPGELRHARCVEAIQAGFRPT